MVRFQLSNGVLHRDGKPVFGLGVSYYASYHPQKVPVPENGDRVAEMDRDLKGIRDAGFNTVRMAALGTLERREGRLNLSFPLVDSFLAKSGELEMASLVRLQGYHMNLGGWDDYQMLDQDGSVMPFHWGWFVRNCVNHDGILRDNAEGTVASARHFGAFPSLVGFQIYNEPAYPNKGIYDYNPHTLEAFRRWQEEGKEPIAREGGVLDAPRSRPEKDGDVLPWVKWRLFSMKRLNGFLCGLSDRAKEGCPGAETFTCNMSCPVAPGNALRGEDYFAVSARMDLHGITHYAPSRGATYLQASMILDAAESAAAVFGKHAWLIEYNGHTRLEPAEWERETYNALGSAFKGILYYQWRADYPFPDSPEPEGFGLVYSDGRPTAKFQAALRMNAMINRLSSHLARAEKVRSGAAILYSNRSVLHHDALDNGSASEGKAADRVPGYMMRMYAGLKKDGIAPDFLRAGDLASDRLGCRLLLVPSLLGLDEGERADVSAWAGRGGVAVVYDDWTGWYRRTDGTRVLDGRPMDVPALRGAARLARPLRILGDAPYVDAKLLAGGLDGGSYRMVVLVNHDEEQRPVPAGALTVELRWEGAADPLQCLLLDPQRTLELEAAREKDRISVRLPEISTGAVLLLGARPSLP